MSWIQSFFFKWVVLAIMLLGLPLLGVWVAGAPPARYLEFPPETLYVRHAPFSWPAFAVFGVIILAVVLALSLAGFKSQRQPPREKTPSIRHAFPGWGWIGVAAGLMAWVLAWTRFPWFNAFQAHTFSPLWFAYIIAVNALCFRRTGHCLLTDRTGYFLLLFPVSAGFWWFFEYLNRFVQNWHYTGVDFSAWSYFWYATLPFSTVLPAVLSTQQWLLSTRWLRSAFGDFHPIEFFRSRRQAGCILCLSGAGLTGIGVWPNYLFPLLWVSPLLIIASLQALLQERSICSDLAEGDWSEAAAAALAAITCGVFWEMWNYFSLAKWEYSIPLVHRFQIFEMPLLGYAGYLPFGLECLAAARMLDELLPAVYPKESVWDGPRGRPRR